MMNGRKIIYITRKELECLDINIPIYVLIDPEPPESSTINCEDIYDSSTQTADSSIDNENINIINVSDISANNSYVRNCQSNSVDILCQNNFFCDDTINFNDDFINSIEISTEPTDNDNQIRTPEYQGFYGDEFYDTIYNSDANSDNKSSDKDSSLRFNSSYSSLTAVVSKTLDSYKNTQSNSFHNVHNDITTDVINGGTCCPGLQGSEVNNMLYGDINDTDYNYKLDDSVNEDCDVSNASNIGIDLFQSSENTDICLSPLSPVDSNIPKAESSHIGCLIESPFSTSMFTTFETPLSTSSVSDLLNICTNFTSIAENSVSFSQSDSNLYSQTSSLINVVCSTVVSDISSPTLVSAINSLCSQSSLTLQELNITDSSLPNEPSFSTQASDYVLSQNNYFVSTPELPSFTVPPPGMLCTSSPSIEPFKIPFSIPFTPNISSFYPLSYSGSMPQIDLSKPPPSIPNAPFNSVRTVPVKASGNEKNPEIEKIKLRRNATRTAKMPLIFRQYSSLEMNLNDRYLKKQKNNKKMVVGGHKMKNLENRFMEQILSRRSMVTGSQLAWSATHRSEFIKQDEITDEDDDLLASKEEKTIDSDGDSNVSDIIKSDSDEETDGPISDSNFTRLQMTQLAQIEKKVEATRLRLNLTKFKSTGETKNNCVYNCRKRTKSRSGYHSNPPKKAKRSAGYLTIQEKNLQNNAPVISGGRTMQQQAEISHKLKHPYKLNPDIWYNEANELNDGPACSCAPKYQIGPLHNEYHGEKAVPICDPHSNNYGKLFHYRLVITPPVNFLSTSPTTIKHNNKVFSFSGYSIFTHKPVIDLPNCQIVRYNIVYNLSLVADIFPPGFTVKSLDLMTDYIFTELLELLDLKWWPHEQDSTTSCRAIHLLPRFENAQPQSRQVELLSSDVILKWMMDNAKQPLFDVMDLPRIHSMSQSEWSELIDPLRGTLATFPGKKPAAIRIDQVDRISLQTKPTDDVLIFPVLVHMSMAPMKLGLTREPAYKRLLRNFLKLQYLILNRPEVTKEDRAELNNLARLLENFEMNGIQRREFTVEISSDGFYKTGISTDIVQFALCIPSIMAHIRFHLSLSELEDRIKYRFKDKSLIHQALTHPSFRNTNYGTNPDHYQNTMTSCGLRHIEYGDKIGLYRSLRKKGLSKMVHVMSHMPYLHETRSTIYGNERLECHGDAVIELITSVHLFYMFPELSEGHLDSFRQALVQNHYLADLAVKLGFHKYLLYTHNMDFSYDSTITHARSDAFEAVMAAVALDGGLDEADRIFGCALFGDDPRVHKVWCELPMHPLQEQFPQGDRHVIQNSPIFQHLTKLEDRLGIHFKHIRLLAKAMTIRKTGFNLFTLGDNQRLEFLGDSLLKYVTTDYLFKHFPRHHEGHISLLRNTLVNRYTQATVCTELGLDEFIIRKDNTKLGNLDKANQKPRADLLEAFMGALFVDKDLTWVERFSQVCFWPRLVDFILNQSWNDPKSRLQQCCLTYRSLNEDPEIAHYKLITTFGSTDNREFKVAVYFRGTRLATGYGKSIQTAQMNAASSALETYKNEFRQLNYQEKVINNQYDSNTRKKILNQFQNWDSELIEKFVDKPVAATMASKFVPESRVDCKKRNDSYESYSSTNVSATSDETDHDNIDNSDRIRSISLTSSLGELLKSVKRK